MKKINELKQTKASKIAEMKSLNERIMTENRGKDSDESKLWNTLKAEVEALEDNITRMEIQEQLDKETVVERATVETKEDKSEVTKFRDWLNDAVAGRTKNLSYTIEERADPFISSTDTGVIQKLVRPEGIDVLTSPGEAFLRNLGVTFYTGLIENFTLPSMGEANAGYVGEGLDGSTANMASVSVTLAARPVVISQAITKQTLKQTSPAVYQSILNNLMTGIWNAVSKDAFTQWISDMAGQVTTPTVAGLVYADLVKMEASIGGLDINPATTAYLTTPTAKAYLKQKIELGTTVGPAIWYNNEINGYKALSTPHLGAGKLMFGDFSKLAIGQWGPIELVVDPYTKAASQQIVITAQGNFDAGAINKRGLVYADVSVGS
jgi:HK97 family phage major capsid protein